MDRKALKIAVENGNIEWQRHALERMIERGISIAEVKAALISGAIIENYPEDKPFPSALFLALFEQSSLHVVAALNYKTETCFVITAYRPDLEHFEPDFKTRRQYGN